MDSCHLLCTGDETVSEVSSVAKLDIDQRYIIPKTLGEGDTVLDEELTDYGGAKRDCSDTRRTGPGCDAAFVSGVRPILSGTARNKPIAAITHKHDADYVELH